MKSFHCSYMSRKRLARGNKKKRHFRHYYFYHEDDKKKTRKITKDFSLSLSSLSQKIITSLRDFSFLLLLCLFHKKMHAFVREEEKIHLSSASAAIAPREMLCVPKCFLCYITLNKCNLIIKISF